MKRAVITSELLGIHCHRILTKLKHKTLQSNYLYLNLPSFFLSRILLTFQIGSLVIDANLIELFVSSMNLWNLIVRLFR